MLLWYCSRVYLLNCRLYWGTVTSVYSIYRYLDTPEVLRYQDTRCQCCHPWLCVLEQSMFSMKITMVFIETNSFEAKTVLGNIFGRRFLNWTCPLFRWSRNRQNVLLFGFYQQLNHRSELESGTVDCLQLQSFSASVLMFCRHIRSTTMPVDIKIFLKRTTTITYDNCFL